MQAVIMAGGKGSRLAALTKDGQPRFNQRAIYRDLPDVLSWDTEHWRTGNLTVYTDY